ncbi:hypothetical protein D8674_017472 [Pyrus ussuriensis x Pyrus communis]|nr:hypothetical protein D8674_017472 [Pyrus ussuriensis x Pyrus communis]
MCPPAPKKSRQAARRSLRRLWPSKSKYFFKVPDDLESLFMVITGTNTPVKNIKCLENLILLLLLLY